MDVDGEGEDTQDAREVKDYGLKPDFSELDEDEREVCQVFCAWCPRVTIGADVVCSPNQNGSEDMEQTMLEKISTTQAEIDRLSPNMKAIERLDETEAKLAATTAEFDKARQTAKEAKDDFNRLKQKRTELFTAAYDHISNAIDKVYKDLTKGKLAPMGGTAYLSLEDTEEPYLTGIKYHAMPPMKRFRDMDQLSGGEKTMAALALLFAIHRWVVR